MALDQWLTEEPGHFVLIQTSAHFETEITQNCRRSAVSFQPMVDSFVLFQFLFQNVQRALAISCNWAFISVQLFTFFRFCFFALNLWLEERFRNPAWRAVKLW